MDKLLERVTLQDKIGEPEVLSTLVEVYAELTGESTKGASLGKLHSFAICPAILSAAQLEFAGSSNRDSWTAKYPKMAEILCKSKLGVAPGSWKSQVEMAEPTMEEFGQAVDDYSSSLVGAQAPAGVGSFDQFLSDENVFGDSVVSQDPEEDGDEDDLLPCDVSADDFPVEPEEKSSEQSGAGHVDGYDEELHGRYYRLIQGKLLGALKDLYGNYADGMETVSGFIVPGGFIESNNNDKRVAGILRLTSQGYLKVTPEVTLANTLWEEFVNAARGRGVQLEKSVSTEQAETRPFKFNPLLQKKIGSGSVAPDRFNMGWNPYVETLMEKLPQLRMEIEKLAIQKAEGLDDVEVYKALSPFVTSFVVINEKPGLGGQMRICCGDLNVENARRVAMDFVQAVNARERSGGKTINMGRFSLENPVTLESGVTVLSFYYDKAAYFSVPDFLGQQLMQLKPGSYKPNQSEIIIGRKLDNTIMTLNLANPGVVCVPINAAPRSGKGVLTLSILANVMALQLPLFYMDGKPDMACLLWELGEEVRSAGHSEFQTMAVDCLKSSGITPIDNKEFVAPYASYEQKWRAQQESEGILSSDMNLHAMEYLKMLAICYMVARYNNGDGAKRDYGRVKPYGDVIVVADEVYQFSQTLSALSESLSKFKKDDKDGVEHLKEFVADLCRSYNGGFNSELTVGIKFISLAQESNSMLYNTAKVVELGGTTTKTDSPTGTFFEKLGVVGKGNVRIYGKKGSSGGFGGTSYAWETDSGNGDLVDLIQSRRHFAMVDDGGTKVAKKNVFKPMLVLNRNDYGQGDYFVGPMLSTVDPSYKQRLIDEVLTDPRLGPAVGFDGVLNVMATAAGLNEVDVRHGSMLRAYELADKALRYYGIIGQPGIESVYDYLTSNNLEHLWPVSYVTGSSRPLASNFGETGEPGMNMGAFLEDGEVGGVIPGVDMGMAQEMGTLDLGDLGEDSIDPFRAPGQGFGDQGAGFSAPDGGVQTPIQSDGLPKQSRIDFSEEAAAFRAKVEDAKAREEAPKSTVTWEQIPEELVEETIKNLYDAIPGDGADVLDVIAHLLVDDVASGNCDPALAEAVARKNNLMELGYLDTYDFANGAKAIHEISAEDEQVEYIQSTVAATGTYGKGNRFIQINSDRTRESKLLNDQNSIDCTSAGRGRLNFAERWLLNSAVGAGIYTKRLWHEVIASVLNAGYMRGAIKKVSLLGNEMYINGKILRLDGVVGGRDRLRLRDIVDLPYMLKKFNVLDELRMDDEILRAAVMQYPKYDDPIQAIFATTKRLSTIIIRNNGGAVRFERGSKEKERQAKAMTAEARVKNGIDAMGASTHGKNWTDFTISDSVWGWRACKSGWRAAGENVFGNNPKFGKATGQLLVGTTALVLGTPFWLLTSGVKSIGRIGRLITGRER